MCFIGDKRPDVVDLAPLPVAQVVFLDGQMSSQPVADLGLVHEPNVNIEHALTPNPDRQNRQPCRAVRDTASLVVAARTLLFSLTCSLLGLPFAECDSHYRSCHAVRKVQENQPEENQVDRHETYESKYRICLGKRFSTWWGWDSVE